MVRSFRLVSCATFISLSILPRLQWAWAWDLPNPQAEPPGGAMAPAAAPSTYPDEAGFQQRRDQILRSLAREDLGKWRRGYFMGGDPGKYLPGAAMAKLLLDPQAQDAIRMMNDDRSYREHYHFAAVNWARFYPIFHSVLTSETQSRFWKAAAKYGAYANPSGTENHRTMTQTSALLLAHLTPLPRFGQTARETIQERQKAWLRHYVSEMYRAGQGEWDSSTYMIFTLNGMLNLYDFHPDPEVRLLARAALDGMAAIYALKYTDGIFTGPNQRGHAGAAAQSLTDQTGWLWWGSSSRVTEEMTRNFRYTLHAITSGWRPNRVLTDIARKRLPSLPFTSHNTKPDYWAPKGAATAHVFQESLYVTPHITMGSLWNGRGGQMTRWQLVVRTPEGPFSYNGGQPTGRSDGPGHPIQEPKFFDGNGLFCQTTMLDGTLVHLSNLPEGQTYNYAFLTLHEEDRPEKIGGWWVWLRGPTWIGVRPLGHEGELARMPPTPRQQKEAKRSGVPFVGRPLLRIPGQKVGMILQTVTDKTITSAAQAAAFLNQTLQPDDTNFALRMEVTTKTLTGHTLKVRWNDAENHDHRAITWIDGQNFDPTRWTALIDGPYVQWRDRVLRAHNGTEGFEIDFTGDLPVYRNWSPDRP